MFISSKTPCSFFPCRLFRDFGHKIPWLFSEFIHSISSHVILHEISFHEKPSGANNLQIKKSNVSAGEEKLQDSAAKFLKISKLGKFVWLIKNSSLYQISPCVYIFTITDNFGKNLMLLRSDLSGTSKTFHTHKLPHPWVWVNRKPS